jgi:hypothetical protein
MSNMTVASGVQIYKAAIEGAKRKFNRSTDDYSVYESMLHEFYEIMLDDPQNSAECERVRKLTGNSWQNAKFPLYLVMFHKHRGGKRCETHARVVVNPHSHKVFDIPLEYWKMFENQNKKCA